MFYEHVWCQVNSMYCRYVFCSWIEKPSFGEVVWASVAFSTPTGTSVDSLEDENDGWLTLACWDVERSAVPTVQCVTKGMNVLFCFSAPFSCRRSSRGHLPGRREEHGPFGGAGVGRGTDCIDINHLLLKDPRHTLSFRWECLTSLKETDVQIVRTRRCEGAAMKSRRRMWKEQVAAAGLSCVQRSPSGVQVIALPHCTLRASVPGQAHHTTGSYSKKHLV